MSNHQPKAKARPRVELAQAQTPAVQLFDRLGGAAPYPKRPLLTDDGVKNLIKSLPNIRFRLGEAAATEAPAEAKIAVGFESAPGVWRLRIFVKNAPEGQWYQHSYRLYVHFPRQQTNKQKVQPSYQWVITK